MALHEILEARSIAVIVANARNVKHVPGRKTDVNDAQWLQQLHEYGLCCGAVSIRRRILRPCAPI